MVSTPQLLQQARERLGISQSRLARASGVSRGLINRYERGHVEPTVEQFNRLLAPLDQELTPRRILTREEQRSLDLAQVAAELLLSDPAGVGEQARRQLETQVNTTTSAERGWLEVWKAVLELPAPIIADLITDTSEFARALRQSSPLSPLARRSREQRETATA